MSARKQPANDGKAHGTKQVRKTVGENVASKRTESQSRVVKRVTTDLTVPAARSGRDSSADGSGVRSSRRPEKPSGRSSTGGQRDTRKPPQRSAADLTTSTLHVYGNRQNDEKVFTTKHTFLSLWRGILSYVTRVYFSESCYLSVSHEQE